MTSAPQSRIAPQTRRRTRQSTTDDTSHKARRPHLTLLPGGGEPSQLALPLEWSVNGIPVSPKQSPHVRLLPQPDQEDEMVTIASGRPHPALWASRIARAIYEVAQGERPANQLRHHVAREQLTALAIRGRAYARHPAARQAHGITRLRRVTGVQCCIVNADTVEASVVLVGSIRAHAMALRLEAKPGSWLVTAVEFK